MSNNAPQERIAHGNTTHDGSSLFHHNLTPEALAGPVKLRLPPPPDCIPVYPLRYGMVSAAQAKGLPATLDTSDYPKLTGGRGWGLRVLRPHSFVYLLYATDDAFVIKGFRVTDDARFAPLPGQQEEGEEAPSLNAGALPYIPAPKTSVAASIQLLICDTQLSPTRLEQLEANQITLPWTSISGWRDTLATTIKPVGGDKQNDTFNADKLQSIVPELGAVRPPLKHAVTWSESKPQAPTGEQVARIMGKVAPATKTNPRLAVVVHDVVGVLSECNHLLGGEMGALGEYSAYAARRKFVSDAIDSLAEAVARRTELEVFNNDVVGSALPQGVSGGAANTARDRAYDAGLAAKAKRMSFVREQERQAFLKEHPKQLEKLIAGQARRAAELWAAFDSSKARYQATLALHDIDDEACYADLIAVCGQTLVGLGHDENGAAFLQDQLPDAGPTGMMRWIVLGRSDVAKYVFSATGLALSLAGAKSGDSAKGLVAILEKIPPSSASRQLGLLLAGLVTRGKLRAPGQFMLSPYRPILQILDGELVNHARIPRGELPDYIRTQMNFKGVGGFRPVTLARNYDELIDVWEANDVSGQLASEQTSARKLAQHVRFWDNLRLGLGGLGTLLSVYNATQAVKALGKEDGLTFSNALNAAGGAFATGAGVSGVAQVGWEKVAHGAISSGDDELAQRARKTAFKCETFLIGFASAAAMAAAIKSFAQSHEGGKKSTAISVAAGLIQGFAGTSGFLHLTARINEDFVDALERSSLKIATGTSRIARLSAGTIGWVLLGAEAIYAGLSTWHDHVADEKKVTDWITRSIWGTGSAKGFFRDRKLEPFETEQNETQSLYRACK